MRLLKIDNRTWVHVPDWKCREEFAEYFRALHNNADDVDLLGRLKAKCDRIELTHKRRCAASRRTALAMWQRPGMRDRVDESQAKAVDVFRLDGSFVATFQSSRKAAIGLGFDDFSKAERVIRAARSGLKKSFRGFMFRDHCDGVASIPAYQREKKKPGYHVNRRPWTYATKPVSVSYPDGGTDSFRSLKECAEALGVRYATIWAAMKKGRPLRCGAKVAFE